MDVAVTQTGTTTSPVTANGAVGLITTMSETLVGAAAITFTVNNTAVDADSVVLVNVLNYAGTYGTNGFPIVSVNNCIAGTSFDIKLCNVHAGNALSGVVKIGFELL